VFASDYAIFLEALTRILARSQEDPDLRTVMRHLAQMVIESTDGPKAIPSGGGGPLRRMRAAATAGRSSTSSSGEVTTDDTTAVRAGDSDTSRYIAAEPPSRGRSVEGRQPEKFVPVDFSLIENRCRLKAEGARWAIARRRLLANKADFATEVEPLDRDLIARAKLLPNCFLWLNHPNGPSSTDPERYDEVTLCFETLADAVALVKMVEEEKENDPFEFEAALNLLAEAQSMLRISVVKFDNYADTDQRDVFQWLKHTASEQHIFIRRFMRLDDPGDPTLAEELRVRIKAAVSNINEARKKVKQHKKLFSKLTHKCQLLAEDTAAAEDYWKVIFPMIDELLEGGIPPGNREIRDALAPVVDTLPESLELTPGVQSVLKELDRFMAAQNGGYYDPDAENPDAPPNPSVADVARVLKGKAIVLIGGERRPASEKALIEAFGLTDLHWISTREHESLDWFEPYISKPEVAVVLLAIRWSSHSYGDVKLFCDRYNKPLVRLPAGYNPNQVAVQFVAQCAMPTAEGEAVAPAEAVEE
jgi:hypothetical protein